MSEKTVGPGRGYLVPITKAEIQPDGRLWIEGLASDESVDSDEEIVDFDALADTLDEWPGNLREMHRPEAVGRVPNVVADRKLRQVRVGAFVSKGAPNTIEKVLDGTLGDLSFGFEHDLRKRRRETTEGRTATRVFPTRTVELSLVDSGANPNAKFTIVKIDELPEEAPAMPEPNATENPAEAVAPEPTPDPVAEKADEMEEEAPAEEEAPEEKIDARAIATLEAAVAAMNEILDEYRADAEGDGPDRVEEADTPDDMEKADEATPDENAEKAASVKADYVAAAEKAQAELRDQVATLSKRLDEVLAQPAAGGPVRAATKSLGGTPTAAEPTLPPAEELSASIRGLPANQQEEIRKAAALSAIRASRQR